MKLHENHYYGDCNRCRSSSWCRDCHLGIRTMGAAVDLHRRVRVRKLPVGDQYYPGCDAETDDGSNDGTLVADKTGQYGNRHCKDRSAKAKTQDLQHSRQLHRGPPKLKPHFNARMQKMFQRRRDGAARFYDLKSLIFCDFWLVGMEQFSLPGRRPTHPRPPMIRKVGNPALMDGGESRAGRSYPTGNCREVIAGQRSLT